MQLEQIANLVESFGVFDAATEGEASKADFLSKVSEHAIKSSPHDRGIRFIYSATNICIVIYASQWLGRSRMVFIDVNPYPWNSESNIDYIGLNVAMNEVIGSEAIGQIQVMN